MSKCTTHGPGQSRGVFVDYSGFGETPDPISVLDLLYDHQNIEHIKRITCISKGMQVIESHWHQHNQHICLNPASEICK